MTFHGVFHQLTYFSLTLPVFKKLPNLNQQLQKTRVYFKFSH